MILAADLGSTNLKCALFSKQGVREADASAAVPYEIFTSESSELSPTAVSDCFFGLIAQLTAKTEFPIEIVAFASQAQTFCVTDSAGRPLSPFYGWSDLRAEKETAELGAVLGDSFHQHTGWPRVVPGLMLGKVLWWIRRNGWSSDYRIVSLPSFLAMQMGAPHISDVNLAAMSGFYSIPSGQWWRNALDAVGIGAEQLGALVHPGESTKCGPSGQGFVAAVKIVMAGNDHTSGAVAGDAMRGSWTLTLGTAGVIYRRAGEELGPFSPDGLWGPYPQGGYYELLFTDHACSALDWADRFLFGKVDSPGFVDLAEKAVMTEDTPLFFPQKWGSTDAWNCSGSPAEKAYAVIEGIGFSLLNLADQSGIGLPQKIFALGGGSRLDFLVQLIANLFQRPITRAGRDGLDGAAILAGATLPPDAFQPDTRTFFPVAQCGEDLKHRYQRWRTQADQVTARQILDD